MTVLAPSLAVDETAADCTDNTRDRQDDAEYPAVERGPAKHVGTVDRTEDENRRERVGVEQPREQQVENIAMRRQLANGAPETSERDTDRVARFLQVMLVLALAPVPFCGIRDEQKERQHEEREPSRAKRADQPVTFPRRGVECDQRLEAAPAPGPVTMNPATRTRLASPPAYPVPHPMPDRRPSLSAGTSVGMIEFTNTAANSAPANAIA